jgi:hypothetical protein
MKALIPQYPDNSMKKSVPIILKKMILSSFLQKLIELEQLIEDQKALIEGSMD